MVDKIKMELKTVLQDQNMKDIHDQSQLEPKKVTQLLDSTKDKSQVEREDTIYQSAPVMYLGEALKNLLARIQPDNVEESGDLWVWIKKLKNQLLKDKGEIEVDKDDIKKLKDWLGKLKPEFVNPVINGQIIVYLNELNAQLTTAQSSK